MKLTDENRLLLLCAKLITDNSNPNEIVELFDRKPDWQKVVKKARSYAIGSACYCVLSKIPEKNLIPDKYLSELKQEYLDTLGRNTIVYNELKALLKIFNQAQIDTVLLKGAGLLASVYPDLGFRFMSDIDILIKESDLSRAQQSLLTNGYSQNKPTYRIQNKKYHHLPPFWNPAKNIRIEAHWTLARTDTIFNIEIADFWSRVQKSKFGGSDILLLSPEDMIIHQCLHLFLSQVNSNIFKTLFDIATIVQHYQNWLDWDQIAACSTRYKLATPVFATLFLINDLIEISIPPVVLSRLRKKTSTAQLSWMEVDYKQSGMESISRNFFVTPGFKKKISYILSRIFPSIEHLNYKYSLPENSKIVYLYYFIRPFHLLYKYSISTIITILTLIPLFSRNFANPKIEKSIYNILQNGSKRS
ncbi:MAG: nucleotidyltransferase family protein [bacterium]|nr:nucleotidyltransferase family protein [bacterium]